MEGIVTWTGIREGESVNRPGTDQAIGEQCEKTPSAFILSCCNHLTSIDPAQWLPPGSQGGK